MEVSAERVPPSVDGAAASARVDAREAVLALLATSGFDTHDDQDPSPRVDVENRGGDGDGDDDAALLPAEDEQARQIRVCNMLLEALEKVQVSASSSAAGAAGTERRPTADDEAPAPVPREGDDPKDEAGDAADMFIRTNMSDYNNKTQQEQQREGSLGDVDSAASSRVGVRDALVNLPSSAMANLPAVLSSLLSDRVDVAHLLPATQDERANAEAMGLSNPDKTAMTISRLSLLAGRAYAELIGMPGAWGAGLIDVGAVSALSALVRRWCVECRGREPGAEENERDGGGGGGNRKRNAKKRRNGSDGGGSNANKRGRKGGGVRKRKKEGGKSKKKPQDKKNKVGDNGPARRSRRVVAQLSDSEGEEEEDEAYEEESSDEDEDAEIMKMDGAEATSNEQDARSNHSEKDMVMSGLRLTLSLAKAPSLPEFRNWSSEAREALLDAVTTALACAAALLANSSPSPEGNEDIRPLCRAAVNSLSNALRTCVLIRGEDAFVNSAAKKTPGGPRSTSKENDDPNAATSEDSSKKLDKSHETAVFVLRGLLPLLSLHVEVPMGQNGKVKAHDAAASVLEGIIDSISKDIGKYDSIYKAVSRRRTPRGRNAALSVSATPYSRRRSTGDALTPSNPTPKTEHKRRKGRLSRGASPAVPPSLKKTVTPSKNRSHTPHDGGSAESSTGPQSDKPRPILSLILGMMQKIATARGLERAQARARAATTIKKCLPRFPVVEQSYFLRFITQLCHSKVSFHRLFGVELIGDILSDDWIWSNYRDTEGHGTPPSTRDTSTMSPALREIMTEPSLPMALLRALHDRMSDRAPAVRARAAHSLSEALGQITKDEVDNSEDDDSDDECDSTSTRCFRDAVIKLAPLLVSTLRKRAACDERATVRKASVVGLSGMLLVMDSCKEADILASQPRLSSCDVAILSRLCGDHSVATRKSAAEALTTLLQHQYRKKDVSAEAELLEPAWADAVLPLVLDAETTCATKAVDFFCAIVLDPLIEVGGKQVEWNAAHDKNRYMTAWRVLSRVSEGSNESGASKGGVRSLKVALKKVFDDAGASYCNISKPLLKEIHRVAVLSLDLDHSMVDADEESPLFSSEIEAQRVGVWCLLDALTDCVEAKGPSAQQSGVFSVSKAFKASSIDSAFLSSSWERLHELSAAKHAPEKSLSMLISTSRECLRVVSRLGSFVAIPEAKRSASHLKHLLSTFELPPDLIGSAVSALIALTKRLCDDDITGSADADVFSACTTWATELFSSCEAQLETFVLNAGRGQMYDTSQLERAIFMVGEISLIGFATDEDASSASKQKKLEGRKDDPVRGLCVKPSSRLVNLIQLLLPMTLPPLDGNAPATTPHAARALAFITLGKLCLRDERLAKDCLNILARELNQSAEDSDPSVQSNVLLVLGDLCIKYTNLVDKFLPVMASCLQVGSMVSTSHYTSICVQDNEMKNSSIVRKHAVLLLSSLVLQDYIKWRGLLIHRFLVACVDDDCEVSHLAETTLCGPLLSKQPNIFFNNFVEALFVLNDCRAHKIYAAAQASGDSGSGISVDFEGIKLSKKRRLQIYLMMLAHMSDEEKIGVTARLAKEVLAGALETDSDLRECLTNPRIGDTPANKDLRPEQRRTERALNVMSDCFAILTSPSARVGRSAITNDADEMEESNTSAVTNGPSAAQLTAVKGRLLSKISRKHLIDTVVPIISRMKVILEKSRSPLLKDLMRFFVEIFRSYKSEVKELLAGDPTLLQELEFDAKSFEKQARSAQRLSDIRTPEPQSQGEGED